MSVSPEDDLIGNFPLKDIACLNPRELAVLKFLHQPSGPDRLRLAVMPRQLEDLDRPVQRHQERKHLPGAQGKRSQVVGDPVHTLDVPGTLVVGLPRLAPVKGGAGRHPVLASDVQELFLKPLEGTTKPILVIFLHLPQELDRVLMPTVGVVDPLVMARTEQHQVGGVPQLILCPRGVVTRAPGFGADNVGDLADPGTVFGEKPLAATSPRALVAAEYPEFPAYLAQRLHAVLLARTLRVHRSPAPLFPPKMTPLMLASMATARWCRALGALGGIDGWPVDNYSAEPYHVAMSAW